MLAENPQEVLPMPDRERLQPPNQKPRYARRDARGRFTSDQSDVGRSLASDLRTKAEHVAPKGQGDRGDRAS
jgi:hypothetical protein